MLIKMLKIYVDMFSHHDIIVIFILNASSKCFLCMERSFTPRGRLRQALNAQKTSSRTKYKQYFFYNCFQN
jgi:hypothetical protein